MKKAKKIFPKWLVKAAAEATSFLDYNDLFLEIAEKYRTRSINSKTRDLYCDFVALHLLAFQARSAESRKGDA